MSSGPIRRAREAFSRRDPVSTSAKERVCHDGAGLNATLGKGYCGRSSAPKVDDWSRVTCTDCHAARRADESAGVTS